MGDISEQDRLDAVENMKQLFGELRGELAIVDALDQHKLRMSSARNLGYYRTFIECSCGAGWWFGGHKGDPSAGDRWDVHRAQVILQETGTGWTPVPLDPVDSTFSLPQNNYSNRSGR